jgi:hypothetical protein
MTHRRLILAALLAMVALGAASWWFADGLSPDEQRLVRMWKGSLDGAVACTPTWRPTSNGWKWRWCDRPVGSNGTGDSA